MLQTRERKTSSSPAVITSTAEFARYVGLARTTVSRVLNGQPGLKRKTIERVQKAMAETGFTPNAYALHLKGKRTSMVGICMENLLTPPAVRKLAELQRNLRDRGFTSLIEVFEPGAGRKVVRHFQSMRVEAIVFIGQFDVNEVAGHVADLAAQNLPHLFIDLAGVPGGTSVSLDRRQAMADVMHHLLGLGHRSFGLLGISGTMRSTLDRLAGIEDALSSARLHIADATRSLDHLHVRVNDFEYGRLLARSFAQLKERPTAFVAMNDEIAIGAMHAFQDLGFSVPEQLSVTGFNNQDICEMTTPGLTSVDQEIEETIRTASELILTRIGKGSPGRAVSRTIPARLVVRGSTGKV
jgi:DNA-binding LacI/PurR family transcriptional regulator